MHAFDPFIFTGHRQGARALATRSLDLPAAGLEAALYRRRTTYPEAQNAAMARCNADEQPQAGNSPRRGLRRRPTGQALILRTADLAQTGLAPGQPVAGKGRRGKLIVGIQTVTNSFNPWLPDLIFLDPGYTAITGNFARGIR